MSYTLRQKSLCSIATCFALTTLACSEGEDAAINATHATHASPDASVDSATRDARAGTARDQADSGARSSVSASGSSKTGSTLDAAAPAGGDNDAGPEDPEDTDVDAGDGSGAVTEPPPDDGQPTWSGIYTYEFFSCKLANCHGKGVAGVDMSSMQAAYNSLVNQPSDPSRPCADQGYERVVPGEPEASLMYLKLNIRPPCGQQMPPGGQLSERARDRVRDWILKGAQND